MILKLELPDLDTEDGHNGMGDAAGRLRDLAAHLERGLGAKPADAFKKHLGIAHHIEVTLRSLIGGHTVVRARVED